MSKALSLLWPYEETEIIMSSTELRAKAPWSYASIALTLKEPLRVQAEGILSEGPQSPEDLQLIHEICKPFAALPLFYFLPRAGLKLDSHLKLKPMTAPGARPHAKWDAGDILESTATSDQSFDAISMLSHLRRLHLLDATANAQSLAKALHSPNKKKLRDALIYAIRQNHYVTVRCQEVLAPALDLHPEAGEAIEHFMKEEGGHDLLMQRSLTSLRVEADKVPVSPDLEKLMDHFRQVAGVNLLGFAFIIDMFERGPSTGKNPIVDKLQEIGEADAARPLVAHSNINVDGDHHHQSFEILQSLGSIDQAYAQQAIDLAQTASDLMISFAKQRIAKINQICSG